MLKQNFLVDDIAIAIKGLGSMEYDFEMGMIISKYIKAYSIERQKAISEKKAILDRYAIKDENGNSKIENGYITIADGSVEEFKEAISALDTQEVQFAKLPQYLFHKSKVKPIDMALLLDVFVEADDIDTFL